MREREPLSDRFTFCKSAHSPKRQRKRGGYLCSPLPPPASFSCVAHSLTLPLNMSHYFPSLPFLQLVFCSPSNLPLPLCVVSGFSGCDACGSAGTGLEPACCSSARSLIVSPSFLSSLGHMVWPKGKT